MSARVKNSTSYLLPFPTFLIQSILDNYGSTKRRADVIESNCVAPGLSISWSSVK